MGPYLLNYQEFRMTGPTSITSINRINTNIDQDGPPDLQDQILRHISSLKALVQKHNESPTGLLKPIRLSFDNEGGPEEELEDLRKPYKDTEEMSYIPDVPVVMQISAFMSNSKCPELARCFSDQVPQTVAEMMRRVDDFVKSEEVFKNTELPKGEHSERPAVAQFRGSRPPRHSYGSRPSRADVY
nr:hypothetical protein [Tanacetum cinerariifolium]